MYVVGLLELRGFREEMLPRPQGALLWVTSAEVYIMTSGSTKMTFEAY